MTLSNRPDGDKPSARHTRNALYGLACVLAVFAILIFAIPMVLADSVWNAIGVAGVAVTIAAVAATVHIFNQQSIDDAARLQMDKGERSIENAETVVPDDAERAAIEAESSNPDPENEREEEQHDSPPGATREIRVGDKTWRIYPQKHVPLFVVADLVDAWREDDVPSRRDGNWTVQNLVSAARRTGPGSHPWLVVFEDRSGEVQVYRLYRGGRGNSGRNARNVSRVK